MRWLLRVIGVLLSAALFGSLLAWGDDVEMNRRMEYCGYLMAQAVHSDVVWDGTWCLVNGVRVHTPGR